MPLILSSAEVVEENIRDHRRRLEVLDVQATNKRLKTEESGYEDRLETANEALQRDKPRWEEVKSDLDKA